MVVLGIETVTRAGSLALWIDGRVDGHAGDPATTHGVRLPNEATDWLGRASLRLPDVDLFAIVAGPGSFTGLRVGMATVQGWAMALGRTVVPVGTLDAMIESWLSAAADPRGFVVACLDGQRGDVFAAAFEIDGARTVDDARPRLPATVGTPAELAREVAVRGGGAARWIGSGAMRYRDAIAAANPDATFEDVTGPLASAAVVIAARHRERAVGPHAVRPIYVRRPDAVIARERAGLARRATDLEALEVRRAAGAADLADVDGLQRRTFTNAWGADAIRWELENTDVARLYVMRGHDAALVGYCACWMVFDELHINSLAIDEPWRRRGAARHLLKFVFDDAVTAGARTATLEVRQSNLAARALYEGLGFRVEGVRRDYYQEPREDALILWNRRLADQRG